MFKLLSLESFLRRVLQAMKKLKRHIRKLVVSQDDSQSPVVDANYSATCSVCQNLTATNSSFSSYHQIYDLYQAKLRGCHSCAFIEDCLSSMDLSKLPNLEQYRTHDYARSEYGIFVSLDSGTTNEPLTVRLNSVQWDGTNHDELLDVFDENRPIDTQSDAETTTGFPYTNRPFKGSVIGSGGRVASHSDATEALRKASRWLRACHTEHQQCQIVGDEVLPLRVIDLGEGDHIKPRLVTSSEQTKSYAALSYVWGDTPHQLLTTADNVAEHYRSIDLQPLPKAFVDFMTVARELEIKYVWIDALCILQDVSHGSRTEWAGEAAKMAFIYQNAFLTVFADCASDAKQGLFSAQEFAGQTRDVEFEGRSVCVRRSLREDHHTVGLLSKGTDLDQGSLDRSPLDRRGWCLQEYLLAPRQLHFTGKELVWQCVQNSSCECGTVFIRPKNRASQSRMFELLSVKSKKGVFRPSKEWKDVRQDYSTRTLTVLTDRLPGLSGLARKTQAEYGHLTDVTYLAGLWKCDLAHELCWSTVKIRFKIKDTPRPFDSVPRPAQWLGPTWSWVSLVGEVKWDRFDPPHSDLKFLDYKCTPRYGDVTGELTAAHLIVQARVVRAIFTDVLVPPYSERHSVNMQHLATTADQVVYGSYFTIQHQASGLSHECDIDDWSISNRLSIWAAMDAGEEIFCILLTQRSFLVVRTSLAHDGSYERVGISKNDGSGGLYDDEYKRLPMEKVYDSAQLLELKLV